MVDPQDRVICSGISGKGFAKFRIAFYGKNGRIIARDMAIMLDIKLVSDLCNAYYNVWQKVKSTILILFTLVPSGDSLSGLSDGIASFAMS